MKELSTEYIALDESDKRQPFELYHIWVEGGNHWRYTSGDSVVTYNGDIYTPATLQRGGIRYDEKLGTMSLSITAAFIHEPVIQFLAANHTDVIWIQLMKLFRDQAPYEASNLFTGTVKSVAIKGVQGTVTCTGFEYFLKRNIPRKTYSPSCNSFLFEADQCMLNASVYAFAATLTSISSDGTVIQSDEFATKPDGWFTLGSVSVGRDKRMIIKHIGDTIHLRTRIFIAVGSMVTAYPGCTGSIEMCYAKFNNIVNFRGFPMIPIDNPIRWSGKV